MINIILCGGSGTRLWPISRTLMPKQFVKLFDNKSLFQLTLKRNLLVCNKQLIISNQEQYFLALDQINELNLDQSAIRYFLEPAPRNTAPAIALACFGLDKDEIVLVTPSDHLIKKEKEYKEAINIALDLANKDFLVTFGIKPTFAEVGFGYIESANKYDVKAFYEKPDFATAQRYVDAGNFYWNSGMFMFKAGVFLEELKKYSPDIYESTKIAFDNANKDIIIRIGYDDMIAIPENSIDYAVMEKSNKVKVVPADIGWSDLGSFDSLYDELPKDDNQNTISQNHISINSKNNLIYTEKRKVATIDIEDLVVVDTGDALLLSKKGSTQKVKQVVQKLKDENSDLHNVHLTGYRPWGNYTVLENTPGYKIKTIVVNPGKRLSLQKHFHRNEHWVVVSGSATVTVGNETRLVRPNESTYIKMGETHRLANDGKIPVVLIEVQVGEYTGEDDIIRIEDDFKRD
ncbi:bifunctional mannose-6-phosphate isomerase / mannose-1-phosphate guanylyltransferase [Campylobacter iguaniorum]|uniref:mannose-1-phosphate guanylyltransferase/mannose-6-phosphate isomerase n=1 Tax=Campylobacter iguaniorum TaxID=1244531 RepID=UPI00073A2629|nr:mannose-1-phosphate guanylyltransferase/mannose-6-phosphate isomerase [Campylobacter iguaniorum]ALV25162.1 bifunctional mannose-6-phosphate isomerase / mannose-1-phosphate guanylyltransferase [Campylobacter iguaniorum]